MQDVGQLSQALSNSPDTPGKKDRNSRKQCPYCTKGEDLPMYGTGTVSRSQEGQYQYGSPAFNVISVLQCNFFLMDLFIVIMSYRISKSHELLAHWQSSRLLAPSRLLRQWSRVRIQHLSQWINSEDRQSHCVYCKISEQRGRPPLEAQKIIYCFGDAKLPVTQINLQTYSAVFRIRIRNFSPIRIRNLKTRIRPLTN